MLVLINNQWYDEDQAWISIFSDAFQFGWGVFETLRTLGNKDVLLVKEHIKRLFSSAEQIDLPLKYSPEKIETMVKNVASASQHAAQRIKIIATADELIVTSQRLKIDNSIYNGVSVMSVIQPRALPRVKSLSYLECFISYRQARQAGFFEALLTDNSGGVYEGSRSNLFWFERKRLMTRKGAVLPGITRQAVLNISPFPVDFAEITISALKRKSEVFLTSSTLGIFPVIQIDERKIGTGQVGEKTSLLLKLYNEKFLRS